MQLLLLKLADAFFFIFHGILIFFNLFGWIPRRTRRLNLFTLVLTGLSWSVLGIWYGFGYCPLTDWHYRVRASLGLFDMPDSYIDFLLRRAFGLQLPGKLIEFLILALFLLALFASIFFNLKKTGQGDRAP